MAQHIAKHTGAVQRCRPVWPQNFPGTDRTLAGRSLSVEDV